MVMLAMDSFDDGLYSQRWWGSWNFSASYGRNGTAGLEVGDGANKVARIDVAASAGATTLILGFAIQPRSYQGNDAIYGWFLPGCTMKQGATNSQFKVSHSAATLTSDVGSVPYLSWTHIGIEIYYHASAGYIKLYINGELHKEATGLNTGTLGAGPYAWSSTWGSTSYGEVSRWYFDDVYFLDDTGPSYAANDFIGDAVIEVLYPSGNGNSSGMLGSDGNQTDNYLLVDNNDQATTDYVGSEIEGVKDTYVMANLPSSGVDIHAIEVNHFAEKTDGGVKYIRSLVRTSSVDYPSSSLLLAQGAGLYKSIFDYNPGTLAEWTASEVDLMEAGQEVRDS